MRALAWASLVAFAACTPEAPRWRVVDGQLRAPDGRRAVLRGVNLAGAHKQAPYLGFHQAADFARLSGDWGMGSVRLLVIWAAVEPQEGVIDQAYLESLATRVAWAEAAGLTVVLDMHQDLYGEGFAGGDGAPAWTCDAARYAAFRPATPWFLGYFDANVQACVDGFWTSPRLRARYLAAWRAVAARLASSPAVVGFDPINEPYFGTYPLLDFEHDILQPFYDEVVAAVRAEAPSWVAFLEPGATRNSGLPTSLAPFKPRDVVYAPHLYDSTAESGGGFDQARRQALFDHARSLADDARALGAALWIGEYGGQAAAPGIASYMDADYAAAGELAAGSAYWSYDKSDGGYAILDAAGAEKPALTAALLRPTPERVAGQLVAWAWDDAARTFTLRYRPDGVSPLPTEIALPPRLYPQGYLVDCGGCAAEAAPSRARVLAPPAGFAAAAELTVTLRPSP